MILPNSQSNHTQKTVYQLLSVVFFIIIISLDPFQTFNINHFSLVTFGASTSDISTAPVCSTAPAVSGVSTTGSSGGGVSTSGFGKEAKKASTRWNVEEGITISSLKLQNGPKESNIGIFTLKPNVWWWLMMSALHAVCPTFFTFFPGI